MFPQDELSPPVMPRVCICPASPPAHHPASVRQLGSATLVRRWGRLCLPSILVTSYLPPFQACGERATGVRRGASSLLLLAEKPSTSTLDGVGGQEIRGLVSEQWGWAGWNWSFFLPSDCDRCLGPLLVL